MTLSIDLIGSRIRKILLEYENYSPVLIYAQNLSILYRTGRKTSTFY